MNKTIVSVFAALAVAFVPASAQIMNCSAPQGAVEQYARADFEVSLKGNWENPYRQQEVTLDMVITAPDGSTLVLPCFHKTGKAGELSTWEARFTPRMVGTYSYTFIYKEKGALESAGAGGVIKVTASDRQGMLSVNDNWTLKYDNGDLFRGIGENICWESRANDDSKFFKALHEKHEKYNYDYMLPLFAQNGGNFIRVWVNGWNFPIDKKDHFNNLRYTPTTEPINESAVQRLDHMMELCEQLGIKVMLCIGAGEARTNRDFFATDAAKAEHQNRLRYIVARWGYSESIGMWEFFNEVDNIQFSDRKNPIPHEDITRWHAEMSKYLKALDPYKHIVTTSISHRDVKGMNDVPDMDINQKHIYKATNAIPGTIQKYEVAHGKPYIIGEFSYEWDWSQNFNDFADGMDWDFRRGLWYGLFYSTPVTPMSWWWEYFEDRDMMKYFKPVREISDMMLAEGKGSFENVTIPVANAECHAVKCGNKLFVYLFNDSDKAVTVTELAGHSEWAQVAEYDIEKVALCKPAKVKKVKLKAHQEKLFIVNL